MKSQRISICTNKPILYKPNSAIKSTVDNRFIRGLSAIYQRNEKRSLFHAADQWIGGLLSQETFFMQGAQPARLATRNRRIFRRANPARLPTHTQRSSGAQPVRLCGVRIICILNRLVLTLVLVALIFFRLGNVCAQSQIINRNS